MPYPQGTASSDALASLDASKVSDDLLMMLNPSLFKPVVYDTNYFFYTEILTDYGISKFG